MLADDAVDDPGPCGYFAAVEVVGEVVMRQWRMRHSSFLSANGEAREGDACGTPPGPATKKDFAPCEGGDYYKCHERARFFSSMARESTGFAQAVDENNT